MPTYLLAFALCVFGLSINVNDAFAARKVSRPKQMTLAGHPAVVIQKFEGEVLGRLQATADSKLTGQQMRDLARLYLPSYADSMMAAIRCEDGTKAVVLPLLEAKTKDYVAYEFKVACVKPDGTRDGWSKVHTIEFWRSGGISEAWDCVKWRDGRMGISMGSSEFVQLSKLIARLEELVHANSPNMEPRREPVAIATKKDLEAIGLQ